MVTTAEDLTAAASRPPMLVGGAALSQKFTDHRIAPAYGGLVVYAEDAMRGLALADRILSGEPARTELRRNRSARERVRRAAVELESPLAAPAVRSAEVRESSAAGAGLRRARPSPLDLSEIWEYVNPHMLYTKHLGPARQLLAS
jgi:5-methyltetrahydrofolate--homocysteine methyltransferase